MNKVLTGTSVIPFLFSVFIDAYDDVSHMMDFVLRSRDFYHTCYCLSGLSIAQHFGNKDLHHELVLGRDENRLVRISEH